jgi:hypothetical protein
VDPRAGLVTKEDSYPDTNRVLGVVRGSSLLRRMYHGLINTIGMRNRE